MTGKALVAGGAGFVGSNLVTRLVALGWRVTCLDDMSTGSASRLASVMEHPRFSLIEGDVRSPPPLEPVEWVFNLACPASPLHYQRDPVGTLMTSVEGTRQLLERADAWGARLLQASTSEIYGSPLVHPQPESDWGHVNPLGPRACYDEGKRCAETLCMDFRRTRGTSVRIARVFNTYGPGMDSADGRVIPTLLEQARSAEPLTLFGDGSQTRSFCYVDDLIEGLLALMAHDDDGIGPVNLGNPEEISMLELAARIRRLVGSRSPIVHRPLPEDDPPRRRPDIELARRSLGWSPRVELAEGLVRTVRWSLRPVESIRA